MQKNDERKEGRRKEVRATEEKEGKRGTKKRRGEEGEEGREGGGRVREREIKGGRR